MTRNIKGSKGVSNFTQGIEPSAEEVALNTRLAKTIQEYWAKRGYDVEVNFRKFPYTTKYRNCPVGMISTTRNGVPVALAQQKG